MKGKSMICTHCKTYPHFPCSNLGCFCQHRVKTALDVEHQKFLAEEASKSATGVEPESDEQ